MTEPERTTISPLSSIRTSTFGIGLADAVHVHLPFRLRRGERRCFGLAVELAQIDAKRAEEQERVFAHRFAARIGAMHAGHSEKILDRTEDQEFAEIAGKPLGRAGRFAGE